MTLKDTFGKLKTTILGTKTAEIDAQLDKVVSDIGQLKTNANTLGYVNLIKNVISKSFLDKPFLSESVNASIATFGQGSRFNRYKTYESIITNINYCYRALNVLTDNILSPDDITKISLDIKNLNKEIKSSSSFIAYIKEIISRIKLERGLRTIIYNTLEKGDFFCEITTDKDAIKNRSLIMENFYFYEIDSEDDEIHLNNIKYVTHNPEFVIKLQTQSYPICLGYLVFPTLSNMSLPGVNDISQKNIDEICQKILQQIRISLANDDEFSEDTYKDLKNILSVLVDEKNKISKNIRFVPPDRMQHFHIPTMKYFPYGESIFDSAVFTAKVLIALETALTIQRLNRSTEKRKINIELGLSRDAKKIVEQLREEFKKRKISLDSFGTIDTIPSMITTFEDIYIPQKDGKPFVDIQTMNEGNVDVRSKVDELKFMRDQLIASLGIPPAFVGIEENSVVKATLSEENLLFARTIIGFQKIFSEQITEFLHKVIKFIDPEKALDLEDFIVVLPTPKGLQMEREVNTLNNITSLIENLERLGIPKEYAIKKYLHGIDWDEIEKYKTEKEIEDKVNPKEEENQFGGGGGGF